MLLPGISIGHGDFELALVFNGSIPAQLLSFYTYYAHACTFQSTAPLSSQGRANDWRREAAPIVCPGPLLVQPA